MNECAPSENVCAINFLREWRIREKCLKPTGRPIDGTVPGRTLLSILRPGLAPYLALAEEIGEDRAHPGKYSVYKVELLM